MTRTAWPLALPALLLVLSGCDPQMAPGYLGDPVVRLHGSASSAEPLPQVDISARMDWVQIRSSQLRISYGQGDLVTRGEFPTHFVLELLSGPGDSWLNDFPGRGGDVRESRIGVAQLSADGEQGFDPGGWYAFSRQVLVYVDRDILPDTVSARFAGGELPAGFHILEVRDAPCDSYLPDDDPAEGTIDCLQPTPDDLDTPVDLRFSRDWNCDLSCVPAEAPVLSP